MSKASKNKIVPILRFPEFRNVGEWEPTTIGETTIPESSQLAQNKLQFVTNGYPVYGADGLIGFTEFFIQKEDYIAILKDGSGVGKLFLYKGESSILGTLAYLKSRNSRKYHLTWLFYLLQTINLSIYVKGSGIPHLYNSDYSKEPIAIPLFDEQQKIADCLSSIDELITAQSQKLDTLIAHKKGLMQQLFPAEGETVPKLRFVEFKGAGEWVKKPLGELIEIKGRIGYRGYTVEDIVNKGEGAVSLSPSNINQAGSLSFEKSTYISWAKYEESPEIMLDEGFTVLVKTGSTFGKAALIKTLPVKSTINPQFVVLKPININSVFLFLIVTNSSIQRQINETVVGGAIPTLSQESISKFEVLIPPDKEKKEQQKIADCLSSIDELITAQSQKIDKLKAHKKGLMQQLFPNAKNIDQ